MATGLPFDLLSLCTCAFLLFCLIISERLKSSNLGSITLLLTVGLFTSTYALGVCATPFFETSHSFRPGE
ncbi:uncharacterized protein GGS22DRAFT_153812 [Annulohypoxylon maeteangense]|uniref:uncharacterized protein n=1 Tax=Annulohypoxylon maeteangense TaxID=1927788 RepID=UPI00200849F1|nr:uncharacterized protein GGS22DRAFT_153812 [Annulohypoxylon maeteangense]KAI0889406.1 hypothetical protein GGS22DRAFT_153812 [Annulohypoxylon maeteangense]